MRLFTTVVVAELVRTCCPAAVADQVPQVKALRWARLGSNQRHLACKQNCVKRCADLRKCSSPTSEIETVVVSLVSTSTCSRVTEYTKLSLVRKLFRSMVTLD